MDKLTAIKIKYDDGTYSDEIPICVLSENVEWDSTHTLVDVLGSVDVDITGTIQGQISQLFNEKVSSIQMQNYISNSLPTYVTNWLKQNVNPVGSAVVVDSSLSISDAAADAKVVGNNITNLKSTISEINFFGADESKSLSTSDTREGTADVSKYWGYRIPFDKNYFIKSITFSASASSTIHLYIANKGKENDAYVIIHDLGTKTVSSGQNTIQVGVILPSNNCYLIFKGGSVGYNQKDGL